MELLFLGTSSGTPTNSRNVSAVAVRRANSKSWCLVDCGEGTQHQILRTNLSLSSLQAIFITHVHGDHCYGLPGLLASAGLVGRTRPLLIISPLAIKSLIEHTQSVTDLHLPYDLVFIDSATISNTFIDDQLDFNIEIVELSHRVTSYAYAFSEKDMKPGLNIKKMLEFGIEKGPLWGNIQQGEDVTLANGRKISAQDCLEEERKPRKIIIAGDNDTPGLLKECAATADVLVHESTYTDDVATKIGPGPQHCSAKTIASFSSDVALKNLVLTHFSARYQDNIESNSSIKHVEDEAKRFYQGNLLLARDFDTYTLNKNYELSRQDS